MHHILITDDDEMLCRALAEELNEAGYSTAIAHSADSCISQLEATNFDLLLLDLKMPGRDGISVLREIHNSPLKIKIIIMTAYADVKSALEVAKLGADEFVIKPFSFEELNLLIQKILA
ncbi:MAG: response regulator [Ignavibacteria bacterium]|nr:response regulator [Ignavibacteria bacterium]